jgi:diguanylate cyclase (GGDEF)-like protein
LFANLPIKFKVMAGPAFVLLALLVMAAAALVFLQASAKSVGELNDVAFERYRLASNIVEATQNAHRLLLKALAVASNEADQHRLKESIQVSFAAGDAIADQLSKLENQFQGESLVTQIRPLFDEYQNAAKDVLEVAQSDPASATLLTFAADRGADRLLSLLENLKADADSLRRQSSIRTTDLVTRGRWWLLIISCVALIFSTAVSTSATRAIVRPILELTQVIRLIAAGKTDVTIPGLDRRDEISVIAEATRLCRDSMITAARLAHYDALTNLANRNLFRHKIEEFLARLRRGHSEFAVFLLDLDKFKSINDTHGHQVGDQLLRSVAERIKGLVRDVDVPARLGGDEFALLVLPGQGTLMDGSQALAARLIHALRQPYAMDGRNIVMGCSIGIAMAPGHGESSDELLKNADLALYKSKHSGRDRFYVFDPALKAEADCRNELENDLRQAIWREEFVLHYQPIVSTQTGQIEAVEALVRWQHSTWGLIPPGRFIRLAEETGLIVQLGEWAITKACHDATKMPEGIGVAVNFSATQFSKSNLVETVIFALVDSQLPPERLEIEITEGVLLEEVDRNVETLRQLQNLGVSIAMDDFGIGYSSLSYLTAFPFNKVKIDKSFIEKLDKAETRAVVTSVVQLSRTLNLITCAEGIESRMQLAEVKSLGVELAQGFLFGKAVPFDELNFEAVTLGDRSQVA